MPRGPSRALQIACGLVTLISVLPWSSAFTSSVLQAIESHAPLTMSVAAWVVLLVPLWVLWFAGLAWRQRDESAVPAVLMALPGPVVALLVFGLTQLGIGGTSLASFAP